MTATCSEPGCERPARSNGLCGTCYARHSRRGTLPARTRNKGTRNAECSADGCNDLVGDHGGRGLCPKHYQRVTKTKWGLAQPPRTAPLAERFAAMVSEDPCPCSCDCVLWAGGINPKTGYGNFSIGNRSYLAHRIAWELAEGQPAPDGYVVDHVYETGCRHRHCVKRSHLEVVTITENNHRIVVTPRTRERRAAAGRKSWGMTPAVPCAADGCSMASKRAKPGSGWRCRRHRSPSAALATASTGDEIQS